MLYYSSDGDSGDGDNSDSAIVVISEEFIVWHSLDDLVDSHPLQDEADQL